MKRTKQLSLLTLILTTNFITVESSYSYPVSKSTYYSPPESVRMTSSAREASRTESTPAPKSVGPELTPLAPGTHNLSIGVGQVFLMGALSTAYENSLGTQLHYTYGVSDLFSFESDFGYSSHSSGNFSLVNLNGALRTNLIYFDQLIPFASLGLGFYRPSEILPNNTTLSALLFGLQAGGGVDLLLSKKMFFGTRLSYHNMFNSTTKASDGVVTPVGGSFISFMLHAGVTF